MCISDSAATKTFSVGFVDSATLLVLAQDAAADTLYGYAPGIYAAPL
jgi:hypothetical protein